MERDSLRHLTDQFLSALALLTRLPLPDHRPAGAEAVWAWPLVGALLGLAAAILASALLACGSAPGPAAALTLAGLARKEAVVAAGLAAHDGLLDDPWQVLRRLGGREIAAMTGAYLAARLHRVPVVLDGFISGAAAAVLHRAAPGALDHCIAGHLSAEGAHGRLLAALGQQPLLSLGMRLGEGSGAALALAILRGAVSCHNGMATFAEAGVSGG